MGRRARSPGRIDPEFGSNGRTEIPQGEDSGIGAIFQGPNDSLLVESRGGNMGCWYTQLDDVSASGSRNAGFERRIGDAIRASIGNENAFVGSVVPTSNGFLLVGTGQSGCVVHQNPARDESGHLYRFNWSGSEIAEAKFVAPMFGSIWSAPSRASAEVEVAGAPANAHNFPQMPDLAFFSIRASGSAEGSVVPGSRVDLRLNFGELPVVAIALNRAATEVVAGPSERNEVRLSELHAASPASH